MHLLRRFGEAEQEIVPAPDREVQAVVTSEQVTTSLLCEGTLGQSRPHVQATVLKLHGLLSHEPYSPWTVLSQGTGGDRWEVRLSNRLGLIRGLSDAVTVEDYVAYIEDWLKPHPASVIPHVINALDLPNAADYLDVVWKIKTGKRLFDDLHVGSCARLTQTCDSEYRFNSLTSALAEVLSSVVPPRRTSPGDKPLHTLHERLPEVLPPENVARGQGAIEVLLKLTLIRNAQQHSNARDRALREPANSASPFRPETGACMGADGDACAGGLRRAPRGDADAPRFEQRPGAIGASAVDRFVDRRAG